MNVSQQTFCNSLWYEAHIYQDGALGICCQEDHKLYDNTTDKYNIKNMSLVEWFNEIPVKTFRMQLLNGKHASACNRCYNEEEFSVTSRRIRSLQKSVIFVKEAFTDSFNESPNYNCFNDSYNAKGHTNTYPIDLHVDLGNYCNLACKMCNADSSSKIAVQYKKWGLQSIPGGQDWTKDNAVWSKFLNDLIAIPQLTNIHLMGGETLLTPRFEQLVDFLILHKRYDVRLSFVTNGTIFNASLMTKLAKFQRVGIEVSIECLTEHNNYVRQGTVLTEVLENIERLQEYASVTIRSAISALTIGYYHTLIEYCLKNKLIIKSLLVTKPAYLNVNVLPEIVKEEYLTRYNKLKMQFESENIIEDYNESDTHNYIKSLAQQVQQAINLLQPTIHVDTNMQMQMVQWCKKWDSIYGYNARALYPELTDMFDRYDY